MRKFIKDITQKLKAVQTPLNKYLFYNACVAIYYRHNIINNYITSSKFLVNEDKAQVDYRFMEIESE